MNSVLYSFLGLFFHSQFHIGGSETESLDDLTEEEEEEEEEEQGEGSETRSESAADA